MPTKFKIAWLCPYPLHQIENIPGRYRHRPEHPSTWIVTLSNALARKSDIELHIISFFSNISRSFVVSTNHIIFHCLRSPYTIPFVNRAINGVMPVDAVSNFYLDRKLLIREINRIQPHLVHAHGTETPYGIAAVESRYPVLISLQGIITELSRLTPSLRFQRLAILEKKAIKSGKYFVAKTDFASRFIRKINPNADIYHIDNIVAPVFFAISRNGNIQNKIIFAGSITPNKGAREAVLAFASFSQKYPAYRLEMIGNGPIEFFRKLKEVAFQKGIAEKIVWHGHLTHSEIAEIYQTAKVLVFPSKMDTSPNVVAEAMVTGLPVIATRVGGIPDMIEHEQTGHLVEAPDPELICSGLEKVLLNQELYTKISRNAREEARLRYSETINVEKVINAYQDIIQKEGVKK